MSAAEQYEATTERLGGYISQPSDTGMAARRDDAGPLLRLGVDMPRAKRICPKPGCPNVADGRYCALHNAAYEKDRGTSSARGYGSQHQKTRARLNLDVQTGKVACARCGELIAPNTPWALDHDDLDRGRYLGPSHSYCNNSAGGKNAHKN